MVSKPHTLRLFDTELEQYRKKTLKLFAACSLALDLSSQALFKRDSDLANQVIADDDEIDELEESVNKQGMDILACFSPVAIDLKFVITLMKVSGILERIGDHSVSICRRVLKLNKVNELDESRLIGPVFHLLLQQTQLIHTAFEKSNGQLLNDNKKKLVEITSTTISLTERLTKASENDDISIPALAELIFISRTLEHVCASLMHVTDELGELGEF